MEYDTMIPRRVERIPAPLLDTGHVPSVALPRAVAHGADPGDGVGTSRVRASGRDTVPAVNRQPVQRGGHGKKSLTRINNVNELFVPLFVAATVVYIYVSATGADVRTFARAEGTSYDPAGRKTSIFTWVDIGIAATLCFFFMSRIRNFF